jgi:ribosomal protein S14
MSGKKENQGRPRELFAGIRLCRIDMRTYAGRFYKATKKLIRAS